MYCIKSVFVQFPYTLLDLFKERSNSINQGLPSLASRVLSQMGGRSERSDNNIYAKVHEVHIWEDLAYTACAVNLLRQISHRLRKVDHG